MQTFNSVIISKFVHFSNCVNVGNMKFMKVKRSENLDAKQLARIDKMWNDGNPEVRTSEKVEIK